jgi:four helix bundle protein
MGGKPIRSVEDCDVYQKALRLFEQFMAEDLPVLERSFAGRIMAKQQLRCLDSIRANMEEGYERKAGKEIAQFFRIAKGSAGESRGRYKRSNALLPARVIGDRVAILNEIRAMLHALITRWREVENARLQEEKP